MLSERLDKDWELGNQFEALWRELSNEWLHTKGFADGIVQQVVEQSNVPPWALYIPMHYGEGDRVFRDEMRVRISQFRVLLRVAMERYAKEFSLRL